MAAERVEELFEGQYLHEFGPRGSRPGHSQNVARDVLAEFDEAVLAFVLVAWIQTRIDQGFRPTILWQLAAYVLLTSAEVMVSITALEFAYTQSPKTMKAVIMSLYLLAIASGNAFTALVHMFIENKDGTLMLQGAAYYKFFAALCIGCVVVYVFVAKAYKEKSYLQTDTPEIAIEADNAAAT